MSHQYPSLLHILSLFFLLLMLYTHAHGWSQMGQLLPSGNNQFDLGRYWLQTCYSAETYAFTASGTELEKCYPPQDKKMCSYSKIHSIRDRKTASINVCVRRESSLCHCQKAKHAIIL